MQAFLVIPPAVYFGFVLSTFATFLFHAVFGRRRRSGLLYWPFGVGGFTAGALASATLGADYLMIGGLPVLGAVVGCVIGLVLAHLLLA